MIHVIASVELNEGKREAFLEVFHALMPKVHAEAGCVEYGPTVDLEAGLDVPTPLRSDVVTILEKWESLDALKEHLVASHMTAYRESVKDLVKKVSLHVLETA